MNHYTYILHGKDDSDRVLVAAHSQRTADLIIAHHFPEYDVYDVNNDHECFTVTHRDFGRTTIEGYYSHWTPIANFIPVDTRTLKLNKLL